MFTEIRLALIGYLVLGYLLITAYALHDFSIMSLGLWWVGSGLIGSGWLFAKLQLGFPIEAAKSFWDDLMLSLAFSLVGPLGMIMAFFLSDHAKYGWKLGNISLTVLEIQNHDR